MARRSDDVVLDLLDAIAGGEYAEGDWLPTEAKLQLRLGTGRDVLRQAIRALQERGLLEVRPGHGQRVRPREAWDTRDPLVLRSCLERGPDPGLLAQTVDARTAIELLAARRAIRRASDADFSQLAERVRAMERALAPGTALRGDRRHPFAVEEAWFHHTLALLSGNAQLAKLVEPVHLVLAELRRERAFDSDAAVARRHRRIVEALSSREDELVTRAVVAYGDKLATWLKPRRRG